MICPENVDYSDAKMTFLSTIEPERTITICNVKVSVRVCQYMYNMMQVCIESYLSQRDLWLCAIVTYFFHKTVIIT